MDQAIKRVCVCSDGCGQAGPKEYLMPVGDGGGKGSGWGVLCSRENRTRARLVTLQGARGGWGGLARDVRLG